MTDTGTVTTEVRDRVLLIGLNRPDKRNALTPEMMVQLSEAYARFDADQNLRCAVLFGHGRAYSAGFDLTRLRDAVSGGELRHAEDRFDPFGCAGRKLSKPVVAAIHGRCVAGGLEVALNCDIIIAGEGTVLGQPEVTRGVFAFGGGAVRWVQRVGWSNAQRYLLTGDTLDAAEALRIGLVQEVVAEDRVLDRAVELARRIAAAAPLAVRASLEVSNATLTDGQPRAMELMAALREKLVTTEDAAEGAASFAARRPAVFVGR